MTYTFEWMVPNRVLKAVIPSLFDDARAKEYDKDVLSYLNKAEKPLYVIVDLRQVRVHPAITTILGWQHLRHPMMKEVILVGLSTSPLVRFIANTVTKVIGLRLRGALDIEEALALATKVQDPS